MGRSAGRVCTALLGGKIPVMLPLLRAVVYRRTRVGFGGKKWQCHDEWIEGRSSGSLLAAYSNRENVSHGQNDTMLALSRARLGVGVS